MNGSPSNEKCLWQSLAKENRPVFLYGTGNGADKILDACELYGISVKGVFASSDFVRSRSFHGMPVRSIDDIRNEFGCDIIVLLAFGTTLDSVIAKINDIASNHTLYIPEVPLYGGGLFDLDYYKKHSQDIKTAENLFCDEESVNLYREMIEFRLTGNPELLQRVTSPRDMYSSLLGSKNIRCVLDCGAYKGDSADDIISSLSPGEVIALEPDPKTFIKLCSYAHEEKRCKVTPLNYAAGEKNNIETFNSSGSRGSGTDGRNKRGKIKIVEVKTIDSLDCGNIQLIKLDVEGNEAVALRGAEKTILRDRPALSVSVYHRTEDIFEVPIMISKLYPWYRLYLRRAPCIPAWDISLIAIPD